MSLVGAIHLSQRFICIFRCWLSRNGVEFQCILRIDWFWSIYWSCLLFHCNRWRIQKSSWSSLRVNWVEIDKNVLFMGSLKSHFGDPNGVNIENWIWYWKDRFFFSSFVFRLLSPSFEGIRKFISFWSKCLNCETFQQMMYLIRANWLDFHCDSEMYGIEENMELITTQQLNDSIVDYSRVNGLMLLSSGADFFFFHIFFSFEWCQI